MIEPEILAEESDDDGPAGKEDKGSDDDDEEEEELDEEVNIFCFVAVQFHGLLSLLDFRLLHIFCVT